MDSSNNNNIRSIRPKIPTETRQTVIFKHFQGLSVTQISSDLYLPRPTIYGIIKMFSVEGRILTKKKEVGIIGANLMKNLNLTFGVL
jgi:hypothetical protein